MKQSSPLTLGTEDIKKLLFRYALPAIVAMTAASLYNMMDSIFIGQGVGALAISGLAVTLPLMNVAAAFGSLVGVGAAALVSLRLGQKDMDGANHILGNVIMLNIIIGLGMTLIALPFLDDMLLFFGASENTLPYARDYMKVILYGNIITHLYLGLNNVLRASGYPNKAMVAMLASVVINCGLNALFIFVFEWGIAGAAWATIVAQVMALMIELFHFMDKRRLLHFQKGILKLQRKVVNDILSIGMSPFLMNLCSCLVIIIINKSLNEHGGDMAVGAYGIVNRIGFLFFMIVMGLNQGMQPIAGYNFGAKRYDRVMKVLKYTIFCATVLTTSGFLLSQIFPFQVATMFTREEDLINLSAEGLRIVFCLFPIVGFQMVTANFFQSIGMPKKAIFLSLSRQLLFLIPFLIIFPRHWGTTGVWMSMPAADLVSSLVTAAVLFDQMRRFRKMHKHSLGNNAGEPLDNKKNAG